MFKAGVLSEFPSESVTMGRMTSLSGAGSGPSSTANWPCELALLMRLLAQTLGFSFQGPVTPMNCARAEYRGQFRPLSSLCWSGNSVF